MTLGAVKQWFIINGIRSNIEICKEMFPLVIKTFRATVKYMVLFEPTGVEVLIVSCFSIIKEGLEKLIDMGIEEETARAFLFGHLNIELAILFKSSNPFPDVGLKQ